MGSMLEEASDERDQNLEDFNPKAKVSTIAQKKEEEKKPFWKYISLYADRDRDRHFHVGSYKIETETFPRLDTKRNTGTETSTETKKDSVPRVSVPSLDEGRAPWRPW